MSSIDQITLPDGTSYELGDFEHYIKNSNYGIDDYDPNRRYRKNQVVWYKGDLFQSVDDNNRGNTPSYDSHYWGVPTIDAYTFWTEQAYSLCRNNFDIWTDTQYFIGDLVNYNGVIYEFTDNCKTRNWQDAEDYTRVFLGMQEGQNWDDYHNHIKWADKLLFDINITDSDTSSKIVQFDSKNSYSSGTLVKNKSGRIMKLTADYIANDPSTFNATNATIDEILQVMLDNGGGGGGDLPSYYDIPEYSEYSTYEVGDYVKHNDNAYRAKYRIDNEAWDSDNFELITFPNDIRRAILHIPDVISLNATINPEKTSIEIPSMSWKEIVNNNGGSIAKKERKLIVNIVRAGSSVNDIVENQIIIDLTYYNGTATIDGYHPISVISDGNIEQVYALVYIGISETNSFVHSLSGTISFITASDKDAWDKVMGSPVSKSVKIMAIGFGQTY